MSHPLDVSGLSAPPLVGKIQKQTKRYFKLKTRTRLLLVFFGSVAIITGWFLPWYNVNYFLTVDAWRAAADGSHYENVAQLSGADDLIRKYGENIAQNEYSGGDLVREGFIKVDQKTFYWWLGLVALTLLVIKLDDLRIGGIAIYLKWVLNLVKILTLLFQVGWVLWYCVQTTSLAWIDNVARTEMVRFLGTSNGILFIQPGLSTGLIFLALGLILNALGVFSGDKAEPINVSTTASTWSNRLRLTAGVCAVIGILFFIITVVTSTGRFPH